MKDSKISWTNHTWNPVHGCSKVSEGCRFCYAEALSLRYGQTKLPWTARNAAENVILKPHKLREPYKWNEPARVFVNSMSDLFHPFIPDDFRAQIWQVMLDCPRHTFQILTKRPELAAEWRPPRSLVSAEGLSPTGWAPNIWMGTSIELAKHLDRLDHLRRIQAYVRFISFEPLLGPMPDDLDLTDIDWAIVGGESGPNYRPMPHAWARGIRDACRRQDVAFFFKQSAAWRTELGTSLRHEDGTFWKWEQYPGQAAQEPVPGRAHDLSHE